LNGAVPPTAEPLEAAASSAPFMVGGEGDGDQDAGSVEGQSSDAVAQKSRMREASLPADARVENAASSGAESGESLEKKKAGCGQVLRTFRFQYRMNAAFAVNGFTGNDHAGISRCSFGIGCGVGGGGAGDGDGESEVGSVARVRWQRSIRTETIRRTR
jgi:hypothetical protein